MRVDPCSVCGTEFETMGYKLCQCVTCDGNGHLAFWCETCQEMELDPPCAKLTAHEHNIGNRIVAPPPAWKRGLN